MDDRPLPAPEDRFVIRIWWEVDLTRPDGRPLWRGWVQHLPSSHSLAFQCLDELTRFIQVHAGDLEGGGRQDSRKSPGPRHRDARR